MAEGTFPSVKQLLKKYSDFIIKSLTENLKKERRIFVYDASLGIHVWKSTNSLASHVLLQSIQAPITLMGRTYTMELKMEDYWKYIDKGIKGRESSVLAPDSPFQFKKKTADIDAIIKWTSQKGFSFSAMSESKKNKLNKLFKGKGYEGTLGGKIKSKVRSEQNALDREKKRKQVAFLIARKIARDGTLATHFYSDVITAKLKEDMRKEFKDRFKRDLIITMQQELTTAIQ